MFYSHDYSYYISSNNAADKSRIDRRFKMKSRKYFIDAIGIKNHILSTAPSATIFTKSLKVARLAAAKLAADLMSNGEFEKVKIIRVSCTDSKLASRGIELTHEIDGVKYGF